MAELAASPRISVIMPTGNVIARAPGRAIFESVLQSVAWADELVIVDSDSHDDTRAVAARYTSKIFVHPYQGSLKRQKQLAIEYTTGDWILWVDADEVLPPALIAEIQHAVRHPQADGYQICRRHYFIGRPLNHDAEAPKMRLWRRGVGHWDGPENDEVYVVPAPVASLATPLEHYSDVSLQYRLEKMIYFAPAHAALTPLPAPADYSAAQIWRWIMRPAVQRIYGVYWVNRGYKDGVRGLIWALLCGITEFYRWLLVWERAQTSGATAPAPGASTAAPPAGDQQEPSQRKAAVPHFGT